MRNVIAQHFLLDPAQRGAHRRNLGHDVDAIAIVIDHLRQAADLTLDAAEPLLHGSLDVLAHALYIPPRGMHFKSGEWITHSTGIQKRRWPLVAEPVTP